MRSIEALPGVNKTALHCRSLGDAGSLKPRLCVFLRTAHVRGPAKKSRAPFAQPSLPDFDALAFPSSPAAIFNQLTARATKKNRVVIVSQTLLSNVPNQVLSIGMSIDGSRDANSSRD